MLNVGMAVSSAKRENMETPMSWKARIVPLIWACSFCLMVPEMLEAQRSVSDSPLPTPSGVKQLNLTLDIPTGGLYLESSGKCGFSSVQLSSSQSGYAHRISNEVAGSGILTRQIQLGAFNARSATVASRSSEIFNPLSTPAQGVTSDISTKYLADPSLVTNLSVLVSQEGALLDLSNLSLNRLSVSSNTGTVHLLYNAPNTRQMEELTINVARALLVIKNLDFAYARTVHVRNDMGDTRIWLGNGLHPGSNVTVKCGTGNLFVYVDRGHPVEIHLRETFLSASSIKDSFQEINTGVYRNGACRYHTGTTPITRIFCQMDMGKVTIVEVDVHE